MRYPWSVVEETSNGLRTTGLFSVETAGVVWALRRPVAPNHKAAIAAARRGDLGVMVIFGFGDSVG